MWIFPDTTGFQPDGDASWVDPASGDRMFVYDFDRVPSLPASLGDLPRLRHALAVDTAADGGLVEAFVVTVDGQQALLQIVKLPLPDRPGQVFVATITVPKATGSTVLKLGAIEGPTTGARESMVLADVIAETGSPDAFYAPHPYAPQTRPKLPWHRADDPRYDERLPNHPLSRARRWLRQQLATARLDATFAARPVFGSPVWVSIGLPIGSFLPLWTDNDDVTFWRVPDPDALRAQLGHGRVDRRSIGQVEACEAGWLHPADGVFRLSEHLPPVQVTPVSDEEAYTSITSEQIVAAFDWIGELSVAAGGRAESLLVRTGSIADGERNYVLLCLQVPEDGPKEPFCVVETYPVPEGAEFWSELTPSPSGSVGYAHPRDAEHALYDSRLTMWAVQTWNVHPFRLQLSYQPNRDLQPATPG